MDSSTILIAVVGLAAFGYFFGRQRAIVGVSRAPARTFHSLPGYYGGYVALWCAIPALLVLIGWTMAEPVVLRSQVLATLPAELVGAGDEQLGLVYNDVRNLVEGNVTSGSSPSEFVQCPPVYELIARKQ